MKAALRRISGDGESEKEWKRLLGCNRGRPLTSGIGVLSRPGGVRISGGSFLTYWPCDPGAIIVRCC